MANRTKAVNRSLRVNPMPPDGLGLPDGWRRRVRWLAIGYAIMLFLWMSTEDNAPLTVSVLGLVGTLLIAAGQATRSPTKPPAETTQASGWPLLLGAWWGGLIGAGASVFTAGLMFFKTAWHSHLFPDFPIEMMLAMLLRAPVWGLAGALMGVALVLLRAYAR